METYVLTVDGTVRALGENPPGKNEEVFENFDGLLGALAAQQQRQPVKISDGAFLVQIYNQLPGTVPIKKFENAAIGMRRILKALNAGEKTARAMTAEQMVRIKTRQAARDEAASKPAKKATHAAAAAPAKGKAAKHTGKAKTAPKPRDGSKREAIIAMLRQGCTREKIQEETGWQAHSVRGFLSTLGKTMKLEVIIRGNDRVYKVS